MNITDKQLGNDIHTVVLYKNADKKSKILVIDPSNPTFSSHIADISKEEKFIECNFDTDIVALHDNKLQIYKQKQGVGTGYSDKLYRDCTNIAAVLAAHLNHDKPKFDLSSPEKILESLKNSSAVKNVTNQCSIYDKLPKILELNPVRIKQSSEIVSNAKTTTILKFMHFEWLRLDVKIKELELSDKLKNELTEKYTNTFQTNDYINYEKAFEEMVHLNSDNIKLLGKEIDIIDTDY